MRLARPVAFVLAFAVVAAAGWGLARPYLQSYFWDGGPAIIDTFGTPEVASSAWIEVDAGAFRVSAPHGTTITAERHDDFGAGRIIHPTFALVYRFGPGTVDSGSAGTSEIWLQKNGRSALLRRGYLAGSAEPWRVSLYVEQGGMWRGQPVAIELHGAFATEYQREMAATVLKSLRVEDLPWDIAAAQVSTFDPSAFSGIP